MLEKAMGRLEHSLALLDKAMCILSESLIVLQAALIMEASIMTDGLVAETPTKSSSRKAASSVMELPTRFEDFNMADSSILFMSGGGQVGPGILTQAQPYQ